MSVSVNKLLENPRHLEERRRVFNALSHDLAAVNRVLLMFDPVYKPQPGRTCPPIYMPSICLCQQSRYATVLPAKL